MKLYEEIVFLKYHFKGKYLVENTESYYNPLILPQKISRHYFWSNFRISTFPRQNIKIKGSEVKDLSELYGFNLKKYKINNKRQVLRNCIEPHLGLHVLNESKRDIQPELFR